jgi:hypothetical protein
MLKHRDLFEPLLPPSNKFFENLGAVADRDHHYVQFHNLDEQPALIKGGEMKDYQVRFFFCVLILFSEPFTRYMVSRSWFGCIAMV